MIKRFVQGIVLCVVLALGYDYGKHVWLLQQIENTDGIVLDEKKIRLNTRGFYIFIGKATYKKVSALAIYIRIPFLKWTTCHAKGEHLTIEGFHSERVKVTFSTDHKHHIEYLKLINNSLILNQNVSPLKNQQISGKIAFSKEACDFFITTSMIYKKNESLFALTLHGDIISPLSPAQQGKIIIRATHFKNLIDLLMGDRKNSLESMLLTNAFGDNIDIPLNLKGKDVYLGPLKIIDIPEDFLINP